MVTRLKNTPETDFKYRVVRKSIVDAFNLALLMKYVTFELSNGHTSWFFNRDTLDDFISKLHTPGAPQQKQLSVGGF